MTNLRVVTALLLAVALMGGCATSVTQDIKVQTDADSKAKFSGYKTYGWLGSASIVYDTMGKWEPPAFDADAELRFLIDRELRKRGLSETSNNPDMIVAFAAGIDMDNLKLDYNPDSDITSYKSHPQGALTVALVDAQTGFAVWIGLATGDIQEEPSEEIVKKRLDYAITQMFKQIPE